MKKGLAMFALVINASLAHAMEGEKLMYGDLVGTWKMIGAYRLHPDGTQSDDYGPSPRGMLIVTRDGEYSVQIYHTHRQPFASPDYRQATPDEYKNAVLTTSTHFGKLELDTKKNRLVFRIAGAMNAAWDNTVQERSFELKGDVLSWRVPPRPDGDVPISVWQRVPHEGDVTRTRP